MPGLRSPYVLMHDVNRVVHWARTVYTPNREEKYYAQPCGTGSRCIPTFYGTTPRWPTCLFCAAFEI